ncbi:MAG: isoprenylcysteine carboxylmethyltransferase family protein [Pseudomonadota bacterium]
MAKWYDARGLTFGKMLDIPPVWLVCSVVLVWLQTRLLPGLTAPVALGQTLAVLLVFAGIGLMIWAVLAFQAHQTSAVPHQLPERIITTGPFAISRNPIYLGDVLVLAAAVLWWGAWPAIVIVLGFIAILHRRFIAPEEARMKESFASEFEAYQGNTRRWL